MLRVIAPGLPMTDHCPWVVVDGAYAMREFLKPALKAGFTVVARLRRDAALFDLPLVLPPGTKRGRGRPPIYGKNALSLAKRAGQKRGWSCVRSRTASGREVVERFKTLVATWRPAGGVIRVVILKAEDDSWRAFLVQRPGGECRVDRPGRSRSLDDPGQLPRPQAGGASR